MIYLCEQCGRPIPKPRTGKKYCSSFCKRVHEGHMEREKRENDPRKNKECKFCGKPFRAKVLNQVFCCVKCQRDYFNYKAKMARRTAEHYEPHGRRERTEDTVFLCHKWHKEGMTVAEIAQMLDRSERTVTRMLAEPLTAQQEKTIVEYFLPVRREKKC